MYLFVLKDVMRNWGTMFFFFFFYFYFILFFLIFFMCSTVFPDVIMDFVIT